MYDGAVWHYKMSRTEAGFEYFGNKYADVAAIIDRHKADAGVMLCCLQTPCARF